MLFCGLGPFFVKFPLPVVSSVLNTACVAQGQFLCGTFSLQLLSAYERACWWTPSPPSMTRMLARQLLSLAHMPELNKLKMSVSLFLCLSEITTSHYYHKLYLTKIYVFVDWWVGVRFRAGSIKVFYLALWIVEDNPSPPPSNCIDSLHAVL